MKLKLVKKASEARGTKSFVWESENKINFLPGQYLYYTLPKLNYPDDRGATRHFTISSSPTEENIVLTTRIREESGYKKTLDEIEIGDVIEGEGPTGTFIFDEKTLEEYKSGHVFLAGGIGITPFRSFIKNNIDKNLKTAMNLIYSNSDSEFVFKNDLDKWQKENDFVKIEYFDSSKLGHLDDLKIKGFLENWKLKISNLTWWAVGPGAFVNAMEDILDKLKVPSDKIITEKFSGY